MKKCIVFITLFLSLTISCSKPDDIGTITVYNRTNENILIGFSKKFPDTSYIKNEVYSVCSIYRPDSVCVGYEKGWRSRFMQNQFGTLIFFIENADTIAKYGIDSLYANPEKFIYKKYFLTVDSMERTNWKLYVQ